VAPSAPAGLISKHQLDVEARAVDATGVRLHELLSNDTKQLMRRWTEEVRGTLHPESMPQGELTDHLPAFIAEVASALKAHEGLESSTTAAQHGTQRLRLGFDLGAVVREYGELRNCILAFARAEGVAVREDDVQVLFDCTITGIAEAVSEYTRQRDAELQRQATEHFAFVAHELRNPLQSARTALGLLERRGELPPGRATEALGHALQRLHEQIEHSLVLASVASGVHLVRKQVRLTKLLSDVEVATAADAEDKGVHLRIHVDGDDEMFVDLRLVHSAIGNLVRNAVKFTKPGGAVDVRGEVKGGRATIEIEDECGGLAPGMVERAFAPFVQDEPKGDGFGLGLAIAKQAVDAHAGTIRVQNLPRKGCIFVLELPIE
jgi:signal transduction histidine kinase